MVKSKDGYYAKRLDAAVKDIMEKKMQEFMKLERELQDQISKTIAVFEEKQYKIVKDLKPFAPLLAGKFPLTIIGKVNKIWEKNE